MDEIFDKIITKPDDPNACWEWTGAKTTRGYAQKQWQGKVRYVHRIVYEHFNGSIPEGLTIDHLCRNHGCANPRHLEAVTNRENVLRGTSPNAENARRTHCKRGHEFTPENTYKLGSRRGCRTCKTAWRRGYDRMLRKKKKDLPEPTESV